MEIKEILQLIERFDASKATKLQLKSADTELLLEMESAPTQTACVTSKREETSQLPENAVVEVQSTPSEYGKSIEKFKAVQTEIAGTPVKAPLVGTYYQAPSPEEKPFAQVGKAVKKGDVVAIIEAMKLMNEITAPKDGVVKEIFAENGKMVEYGEVLMVLE